MCTHISLYAHTTVSVYHVTYTCFIHICSDTCLLKPICKHIVFVWTSFILNVQTLTHQEPCYLIDRQESQGMGDREEQWKYRTHMWLALTHSHGSPYPSSRCPRRLLLDSWFRRSHLLLSQSRTSTQLSDVAMQRTENQNRQAPNYQGPLHWCLGENRSGSSCNKAGESTSEGQENARMSDTSSGKYYSLSSILDCTCNM